MNQFHVAESRVEDFLIIIFAVILFCFDFFFLFIFFLFAERGGWRAGAGARGTASSHAGKQIQRLFRQIRR
jgi:hypothetical protein